MRDTEREIIQKAISYYESFSRIYDSSILPGQVSEMFECRIALQYLKSSFFEIKLRGMSELKSIFTKVRNSGMYSEEQIKGKELPFCRYLD